MNGHYTLALMALAALAALLTSASGQDDDLVTFADGDSGKRAAGMNTLRFGKRSKGMAALRFGKRAGGMSTLRFGKRMRNDLSDMDEDMLKMLLRLRSMHHGKRSDDELSPTQVAHLRKIMMHLAKRDQAGRPIELSEEELMKLLIQLRSLHHG